MNIIQLDGNLRTDLTKPGLKQLRKSGLVPCSIYSHGVANQVLMNEQALHKLIYTPHVYLVELKVENNAYKCVMKGAQFHPVHENLLSVEFVQVSDTKPLQVDLPIVLTGNSEGVLAGGKLVQKLRKLRVRGMYTQLPAQIEIDVTNLKLGRTLKVADLEFTEFMIPMAKDVPIASIEVPRALRTQAVPQAAGKKK